MTFQIKKRGRPTKAMLLERMTVAPRVRTDAEVLQDLADRFDMLRKLTQGAIGGTIRSLAVTGAPGVGKTYNVEQVLEQMRPGSYDIVKGSLTAVNLYKLGYQFRNSGNVIVLDDADVIFTDEEALNVLKALCDSSPQRRVHWLKESSALKEEDVPTMYEFNGAFIFISNLDFQKYVDMGGNKYVAHFEALMSRSLYLDLRLHDRQAISLWVRHIATEGKMFEREGVSLEDGERLLGFLMATRQDLREFSLRTLLKVIGLWKSYPEDWERYARVLLLRSV